MLFSLTYCSFDVRSQVRSNEMHQRAEFGLAAHWSYKGSGMGDGSLDWISSDASTEGHKVWSDGYKTRTVGNVSTLCNCVGIFVNRS